ncbi:hypothetical protein [Streptomyces coelicoflavus]|uniref:hypothetical protein n=1 Tax=Streptomyces coelicoflavus TaxID=285562 RepID=UPI002E27423F
MTDARADRVRLGPGTLPPPSLDGDSGRSLILVEALSTHWETVTHAPYTKTVGCEVALS